MFAPQRTRNLRRHKLLSVDFHRERPSGPLEEDAAGACRGGKSMRDKRSKDTYIHTYKKEEDRYRDIVGVINAALVSVIQYNTLYRSPSLGWAEQTHSEQPIMQAIGSLVASVPMRALHCRLFCLTVA